MIGHRAGTARAVTRSLGEHPARAWSCVCALGSQAGTERTRTTSGFAAPQRKTRPRTGGGRSNTRSPRRWTIGLKAVGLTPPSPNGTPHTVGSGSGTRSSDRDAFGRVRRSTRSLRGEVSGPTTSTDNPLPRPVPSQFAGCATGLRSRWGRGHGHHHQHKQGRLTHSLRPLCSGPALVVVGLAACRVTVSAMNSPLTKHRSGTVSDTFAAGCGLFRSRMATTPYGGLQ